VKQGQVIVRAPHFVDDAFISAFLDEKSVWLKSKIASQQQVKIKGFDFSQNSELFLFGKKVKLNISYGSKNRVLSEVDFHESKQTSLTVIISERNRKLITNPTGLTKQIKKQLELYFRNLAQDIILPRVAELSKQVLLRPKEIKIRQYSARWGSCNSRDELSFNYLLVMTPLWVIDYVIIHELCHLKHLNHSTDFWQLVAKQCPNYPEAKQWLTRHQGELIWQLPN